MHKYSYEYPRPGLTSDIVLMRFKENNLEVLLIERKDYPFEGSWALPGGFVDEGETAEIAAERELFEETGIQNVSMQQVFTTTTPGRDPRGWTVSVIFVGFVNESVTAIAGDDARKAEWFSMNQLPGLAFDHSEGIRKVMSKLYDQAIFSVFGYEIMPDNFNRNQLRNLYEQVNLKSNQINKLIEKLIYHRILTENNGLWNFSAETTSEILKNGFDIAGF